VARASSSESVQTSRNCVIAWGQCEAYSGECIYHPSTHTIATVLRIACFLRSLILAHRHNNRAKWLILSLCLLPLSTFSQRVQRNPAESIPVLVYHRFDPNKSGPTTVKTSTFEGQLVWLADHYYRVVPLSAVTDMLRGIGPDIQFPAVAITADDGHRSVYTEMFPVIRRYRIPVTLFIYPSAISNAAYALTWAQLREMKASGLVDIQSHTYWHPNFNQEKKRRTPEDYQQFVAYQLVHSRVVLEQRLALKVDMLAWPYGVFDPELEEAAVKAGYICAFAYTGGPAHQGSDLFAIPRIPVSDQDQGVRFGQLLENSRRPTVRSSE